MLYIDAACEAEGEVRFAASAGKQYQDGQALPGAAEDLCA